MPGIVTIIVHGTFAAQAAWWRLGSGETFADRLEQALSAQGMAGTVWDPILRAGLSYDDFSWSGENTHRARIAGGRKLARALDDLAGRLSATATSPLYVNLVAHSHGGNVALEALRHVGRTVRVRRLACLGTPLISFRPALRLVRPISVSFLTLFVVMFAFLPFMVVPTLFRYSQGMALSSDESSQLLAAIFWPLLIAMWGWMLLGMNKLMDLIWSVLCWGWLLVVGQTKGQAYGPSPQKVASRLAKNRVLVLTSHFDEADLFLELSAAPAHLYKEFAQKKYSGWQALVERVIFRPALIGLLLHPAELVLERFVLGIGWLRLFFFDYDATSVLERGPYPPTVFQEVDLTKELQLERKLIEDISSPAINLSPVADENSLGRRLYAVGQALAEQVRLRHAMYYQNAHVLGLVSNFLAKM